MQDRICYQLWGSMCEDKSKHLSSWSSSIKRSLCSSLSDNYFLWEIHSWEKVRKMLWWKDPCCRWTFLCKFRQTRSQALPTKHKQRDLQEKSFRSVGRLCGCWCQMWKRQRWWFLCCMQGQRVRSLWWKMLQSDDRCSRKLSQVIEWMILIEPHLFYWINFIIWTIIHF